MALSPYVQQKNAYLEAVLSESTNDDSREELASSRFLRRSSEGSSNTIMLSTDSSRLVRDERLFFAMPSDLYHKRNQHTD